MKHTEKKRQHLIRLLEELFQLEQPDLDFGFYRIMHAKADEVKKFLENDLLKIIEQSFYNTDTNDVENARQEYEVLKKEASDLGEPDPDSAPKVKEAKATWEAAKENDGIEGEIYDHLYRFFERYYDQGDFMSRRYYARETDAKAAPYAVPYDGREVYMHWANRDQYYIKTSEYLSNFTFDLANAKELQEKQGYLLEQSSLKVHCRIVEAQEGEHNNVKETENTERYFIIHKEKPVKLEDGDLVIQFEYRHDQEKTGKDKTWHQKRLNEAARVIKEALPNLDGAKEYNDALLILAPTEKNKHRTLLEKYLAQYTARNTMDYFIHKDLGGFLRRELDFYIKNEIMRLDDIESADAPRVQTYLDKIKVLRQIAHHLIDFLAQLEEFQKKLWLKKKFVTDTQYCITLDRIPESFYEEIVANDAQRAEWVNLFAIDELDGYTDPLNIEFLKNNPFLILDTAFFPEDFKNRLLAEIQDLDERTDGLLIHSENFQALNLIVTKHQKSIQCIYIDPPYNTAASEILYKNAYKHSSWCSLMQDRIIASKGMLKESGILQVAIDDMEFSKLENSVKLIYGDSNFISNIAVMHNPKGRDQTHIADCHEYTILAAKNIKMAYTGRLKLTDEALASKYSKGEGYEKHRELPLRRSGSGAQREDRPYMFFPFIYDEQNEELTIIPEDEYEKIYDGSNFNDDHVKQLKKSYQEKGYTFILPIRDDGTYGRWRWGYKSCRDGVKEGALFVKGDKNKTIYQIDEANDTFLPKSLWYGDKYDASSKGTNILKNIVGPNDFDYPKSLFAVKDFLIIGSQVNDTIIDFFAGSGTTAHAAIELNRENQPRKYVMIEMGDHFNNVLRPRLEKVIYSKEYKKKKPVDRDGISHAFKYIRLESYEDALNNLAFLEEDPAKQKALESNPDFRRDYMLRYWLDFETKGSPSLLNIDWFDDPTNYTLKVKKPGTDEYAEQPVDLIETFNWLIGLHVDHIDVPRTYTATFKREEDPELPGDQTTRLVLNSRLAESNEGEWWFRKVEGRVCRTPGDKSNMDRVLIIWRKLTSNLEKDNLMLDEWFKKYRLSTQDKEFDVIYVNGSNNLPNIRQDNENWKVRLLEETFHQKMWDVEA